MSQFYEADLEQATLDWLAELDYERSYGPDIAADGIRPERESYADVVLKDRLEGTLHRINPSVSESSIRQAVRRITMIESPNLIINNRQFQQYVTDGIDIENQTSDGRSITEKVWLFDFEIPLNNDFLAVNQFTVVEGNNDKRPDVVLFVNGLPLVVVELKSSSDETADITKAFQQLQTYKKTIPSLFTYNAFLIISDGVNARMGSLTAQEERFMLWRTTDGETLAPTSEPQLETLLKGMLRPDTLLDLLQHFIVFQTDGEEIYKIVASYHQYFAVNKAVTQAKRAASEEGDRKIGVIWHTQGSGKSLSMVFFTGKLVLAMNNPTVVVLTDRNDLDNQLFSTFAASDNLLRQTPQQAESRKGLKNLLRVEAGGIVFTTMQKFAPEEGSSTMDALTERHNVIVIADEAHRSQYGFQAEMTKTDHQAAMKYGYAKYMRDALPNASFIGFTGTPIELADKNTPAVFGHYIDVYDMTQSVEDESTVRIYYESRIVQLNLPEDIDIDDTYETITEEQEASTQEHLKSKWSRLEALAGAEDRLKMLAKDFVQHYEERQQAIFGKAMMVVMSRRIAVDLYEQITKLRPDWHHEDDDQGVIKIVMTGSSSDPEHWQQHVGTKRRRDYLARRMKDPEDALRIVIVCDMWLTGFDAPSMHTMYIDKPMHGHNLMQAIARVNRVFRDKPGGLIVDYIGIADSLKEALKQYTESDRNNTGIDTSQAVAIMLEKHEVIRDMLYHHDYAHYQSEQSTKRMQAINETMDFVIGEGEETKKMFIQTVTELGKAFSLCATEPEAQSINDEIGFFQSVKSGLMKLIAPKSGKKTSAQMDAQLQQLVSQSIISEDVVDIYDSLGLENPDISILSDQFLEDVRELPQKNVAVELLDRLLKGKVRAFQKQNLVQARKFSDMLENAVNQYNKRAIETSKVIEELIDLAKDMQASYQSGEEGDMTPDELAFYDALSTHETAEEVLGDDTLRAIAFELTKTIKNNMSIDWNLRESARANMRRTVRRLLKKYGYPPDLRKMAVETVVEQAELMAGNMEI